MSLHKFYFDAICLKCKNPSWRYGQAMFNHLHSVRPDLSEQVRGTDFDPFYCTSPDSPKFDAFIEFIESQWK